MHCRVRTSFPSAVTTCPEPGGSACFYWNGYGTQRSHPAQGLTSSDMTFSAVVPYISVESPGERRDHLSSALKRWSILSTVTYMPSLWLHARPSVAAPEPRVEAIPPSEGLEAGSGP